MKASVPALVVILPALAYAEPTKPEPLVESRTWTRAADGATFVGSVLHVRDGQAVFADASGKWYAAPLSALAADDQAMINVSAKFAPKIPAGHLVGATRAQAAILLGPPKSSYPDFDSWPFPVGAEACEFFIKVKGGKIGGFMLDLGWQRGLADLLDALGLDHFAPGRPNVAGPIETINLIATGQPLLKFRGTKDTAGWSPVNIDIE